MNSEIAVDFGTSEIRIYADGKGIVVNDADSIAVDMRDDAVLATGRNARAMTDRASAFVQTTSPFTWGRIQNYPMAAHLVSRHLKRVSSGRIMMPDTYIAVPEDLSSVEKQAIKEVVGESGIKKIFFINDSACAAMGAGRDIFTDIPVLVLDMGASKSTCAIYEKGELIASGVLRLGGRDMDDAIVRMAGIKYGLTIGRLTAEDLKIRAASAVPNTIEGSVMARGMDARTCLPAEREISAADVSTAVAGILDRIAETVLGTVAVLDNRELENLHRTGISVTGGLAKLKGIDFCLKQKSGLSVFVPLRPELCTVNGAAAAFNLRNKVHRRLLIESADEK